MCLQELVRQFELKQKQDDNNNNNENGAKKIEEEEEDELPYDGFDKGLPAESIVGATREDKPGGKMLFLVKWVGSEEADLVLAEEANRRIPHLVIQFYQSRLNWSEPTSKDKSRKGI